MGFLHICNGDKLVRYRSIENGSGCNCASLGHDNFIYTDGCLYSETGQGGYGIYSSGLGINLSDYYPQKEHKNVVPRLELKGILEAVKYVKDRNKSLQRIDIFTDCELALTHLVNLDKGEEAPEIYNHLGASILKEIKEDQGSSAEVHMQKVKGHSGNHGNNMANRNAKSGAHKAPKLKLPPQPPAPPSSVLCSREVNDKFYPTAPDSMSSYTRKRLRLSQSPCPSKRVASPSPSPVPSKMPRGSIATGPRNNYVHQDLKSLSSATHAAPSNADSGLSKLTARYDPRNNYIPSNLKTHSSAKSIKYAAPSDAHRGLSISAAPSNSNAYTGLSKSSTPYKPPFLTGRPTKPTFK